MQTADQQQQPTSDDITQPEVAGQPQDDQQPAGTDTPQPDDKDGNQQEGDGKEGQDEGKKPEVTPAEKESRALKRRIDRLTRNKYQSEAQMQQLQAELAQLRAQLGQGGADDQQASAATPKPADLQRQAREMVEIERINARCDDVAAKGEATYPDFKEKVVELGQELPLFDPQGRPAPILQTILESDDPTALIYHLGSNPDEAAELADMTPRQQLRRLIQIEAELGNTSAAQPTAQAPAVQKPPVSKAPPPVQPNRSAVGQFTKDPATMDDAEWWEYQQQQSKSKR